MALSENAQYVLQVQELGLRLRMGVGDTLGMINRNYGFCWEGINAGNVDEIKTFLLNNYVDRLKLLRPELHEELMKTSPHYRERVEEFRRSIEAKERSKRNAAEAAARMAP